ncbi:restriction endonuclease [Kitasatospora purpeofusca]|uniref:restriction endonuclease n=1 Tax=Kitasatospora purpeofusca TaxID=67352 RepID=UPI0035E3905A
MIIERDATVTPTRYAHRDLRKELGVDIAKASSDDLLAAWLWSTEARYCRVMANRANRIRDAIDLACGNVRLLKGNEWPESGGDRTPVGVRGQVDAALDHVLAQLELLDRDASGDYEQVLSAWRDMSREAGVPVVELFSGEGDRRRAPVEGAYEAYRRMAKASERLDALLAELCTEVHAAALLENERHRSVQSGRLPPEAVFLRSVHQAVHRHRIRVSVEVAHMEEAARLPRETLEFSPYQAESEISRKSDTGSHGLRSSLYEAIVEWSPIRRQLADQLEAELNTADQMVARAGELWDALAPRCALTPERGGTAEPADSAGLFGMLAQLSQEVSVSRDRLEEALSEHRALAWPLAMRANRRCDWARSGRSLGMEDIRRLHHREFEHLVADLLERDGLVIEQAAGGAGDLGADVIARCPETGRRIVVQCKHTRTGAKVGTPDLQRFKGTVWDIHQADVALLVTNAAFSRKAKELAGQFGIQLMGGPQMDQWARLGDPLTEVRL